MTSIMSPPGYEAYFASWLARRRTTAPPSHALDVKPGQFARLRAAALLVRIGLDHEPWLAPVLKTVAEPRFTPGRPHYLDAARGIELLQAETPRVKSERGVHDFAQEAQFTLVAAFSVIVAAINLGVVALARRLVGVDGWA